MITFFFCANINSKKSVVAIRYMATKIYYPKERRKYLYKIRRFAPSMLFVLYRSLHSYFSINNNFSGLALRNVKLINATVLSSCRFQLSDAVMYPIFSFFRNSMYFKEEKASFDFLEKNLIITVTKNVEELYSVMKLMVTKGILDSNSILQDFKIRMENDYKLFKLHLYGYRFDYLRTLTDNKELRSGFLLTNTTFGKIIILQELMLQFLERF